MRSSRRNKIDPSGNPAIVRSIPAVFPQHRYPHPREIRGFRGIPAVPIPVHTSTVRTNMVATRSGNVFAMIAKLVVKNAAAPNASTNRTRKHIVA